MKDKLSHERAFTLLDLLAVLAVIAIVGSLLLPAMARTRIRSGSAGCLSNKRQVMVAWAAYAADNADVMCPNSPYGTSASQGWIGSSQENWSVASGNTNVIDLEQGLLYRYLPGGIIAYRCPADYLPSANGIRLRSISMIGSMGAIYEYGAITTYNTPGVLFIKVSDLTRLAPPNAIVFADESMATLSQNYGDGWLQVDSQGILFFPNIPGNYHDGAGSFGYADGHGEIHQWQTAPLLGVPYSPSYVDSLFYLPGVTKQNADWVWWAQRVDFNP